MADLYLIILLIVVGTVINFGIRKIWISKALFGNFWEKFENADAVNSTSRVYIAPVITSVIVSYVVYTFIASYASFDNIVAGLIIVVLLGVMSFLLSFQCFLLSGRQYRYYINHYIQVISMLIILTLLSYFLHSLGLSMLPIIVISTVVIHVYGLLWHSKRLFEALWSGFDKAPDKCGNTRKVYAPIITSAAVSILVYYLMVNYLTTSTVGESIYFVVSFGLVAALLSFHCFLKTGKSYAFFFNHYMQVLLSLALITTAFYYIVSHLFNMF